MGNKLHTYIGSYIFTDIICLQSFQRPLTVFEYIGSVDVSTTCDFGADNQFLSSTLILSHPIPYYSFCVTFWSTRSAWDGILLGCIYEVDTGLENSSVQEGMTSCFVRRIEVITYPPLV